jgi:hypothetical protein
MSNALNVIRNNSLMCQNLRSDLNDLNNLTKSKVEEVTSLKDNIQLLEAKVNSLTKELKSLKTTCCSSTVEEEPVVEETHTSVEEEPVVEENLEMNVE